VTVKKSVWNISQCACRGATWHQKVVVTTVEDIWQARGALAYNRGLRAKPPAGSRGRAPCGRSGGKAPWSWKVVAKHVHKFSTFTTAKKQCLKNFRLQVKSGGDTITYKFAPMCVWIAPHHHMFTVYLMWEYAGLQPDDKMFCDRRYTCLHMFLLNIYRCCLWQCTNCKTQSLTSVSAPVTCMWQHQAWTKWLRPKMSLSPHSDTYTVKNQDINCVKYSNVNCS